MIAAVGDESGGAFGSILFALLILAVAGLWILFPILVWSKFNELLEVQRRIHAMLQSTNAALESANKARAEITKALQWMVDH